MRLPQLRLRSWPIPIRGLYGALISAIVGAVVPAAIVLVCTTLWWHAQGSSDLDRTYDRNNVLPDIPSLVVVGAVVFACAGWATFAPRGKHRFARTLAIVVAITAPLWAVVGWFVRELKLTPVRYKGVEHPAWYQSEVAVAIVCLAVPIVVAVSLSAVRDHRASNSEEVTSGPPMTHSEEKFLCNG
jgi:uncharacterized membrane protein